jgi:hypothetical protein
MQPEDWVLSSSVETSHVAADRTMNNVVRRSLDGLLELPSAEKCEWHQTSGRVDRRSRQRAARIHARPGSIPERIGRVVRISERRGQHPVRCRSIVPIGQSKAGIAGCRAHDPLEKKQIHAVPGQEVEAMIARGPGSPGGPASDWRIRSVNVGLIEPARWIRCGPTFHHGDGLPVRLDGRMVRVAVVQGVNVSA